MYELKTKRTDADVADFMASVADRQREDAETLLRLMEQVTGEPAKMWGDSVVGFGEYAYRTRSGIEGQWYRLGFSPRKQNLTIYVMPSLEMYPEWMGRLGKYTTGKSCIYAKRLSDLDLGTLKRLLEEAWGSEWGRKQTGVQEQPESDKDQG